MSPYFSVEDFVLSHERGLYRLAAVLVTAGVFALVVTRLVG